MNDERHNTFRLPLLTGQPLLAVGIVVFLPQYGHLTLGAIYG